MSSRASESRHPSHPSHSSNAPSSSPPAAINRLKSTAGGRATKRSGTIRNMLVGHSGSSSLNSPNGSGSGMAMLAAATANSYGSGNAMELQALRAHGRVDGKSVAVPSRAQKYLDEKARRLARAEIKRREDIKHKTVAQELRLLHSTKLHFLFYCGFMILFTIATIMARGDENSYYTSQFLQGQTTQKTWFDPAQSTVDFYGVGDNGDLYSFFTLPVMATLFKSEYDVTEEQIPNNLQYYGGFSTKLLGALRVRVIRGKPNTCDMNGYNIPELASVCYHPYSSSIESTDAFGPLVPDESGTGMRRKYQYRSADQLKEAPWQGQFALYGGGGFAVDVPYNRSYAMALWDELFADGFFDPAQSLLITVDMQGYNPALNLHVFGRMAFEHGPMGFYNPFTTWAVNKLNRYAGAEGAIQMLLEVLILLSIVFFVALEIREVRKAGIRIYLQRDFVLNDLIILLMFLIIIILRMYIIDQFKNNDPVKHTQYVSMSRTMQAHVIEDFFLSVVSFFLWLKIFKYLTVYSSRISFLNRTFRKAGVDLFFFMILFCVLFLSYAHAGYLAFSHDCKEFRSFTISFVSLFRGVVSGVDSDCLVSSNRYFGPIFFISFQMIVIMIMINMFVGILGNAYTAVQEEDDEDPTSHKPESLDELFENAVASVKQSVILWWGKMLEKIHKKSPKFARRLGYDPNPTPTDDGDDVKKDDKEKKEEKVYTLDEINLMLQGVHELPGPETMRRALNVQKYLYPPNNDFKSLVFSPTEMEELKNDIGYFLPDPEDDDDFNEEDEMWRMLGDVLSVSEENQRDLKEIKQLLSAGALPLSTSIGRVPTPILQAVDDNTPMSSRHHSNAHIEQQHAHASNQPVNSQQQFYVTATATNTPTPDAHYPNDGVYTSSVVARPATSRGATSAHDDDMYMAIVRSMGPTASNQQSYQHFSNQNTFNNTSSYDNNQHYRYASHPPSTLPPIHAHSSSYRSHPDASLPTQPVLPHTDRYAPAPPPSFSSSSTTTSTLPTRARSHSFQDGAPTSTRAHVAHTAHDSSLYSPADSPDFIDPYTAIVQELNGRGHSRGNH